MKKILYIVLGVQSFALLGVVGFLAVRSLSSGHARPPANTDTGHHQEVSKDDAEAPESELDAGRGESEAAHGDGGAPGVPARTEGDGGVPAVESSREAAVKETLSELMDGNERFAHGLTRLRDPLELRRAPGRPRAVVLACSDAVVPPELVFDQPLGALVVTRTPAHLVDPAVAAAVDDALKRDGVPLVVVLGHLGCPTVKAAMSGPTPREPAAAARLRGSLPRGQKVSDGVEANTSLAVKELVKASKALRGAHPNILRVVYDEETGQVRWLDAEPH